MPVIAVDAMGGDLAPRVVMEAVADISRDTEIDCLVLGDEARLQRCLDDLRYNPERIEIVHAPAAVDDADDHDRRPPRDASIVVAARLTAQGRAAALVTAGNTRAAIDTCVRHFPIVRGVRQAALASVYPRRVEYPGQDYLGLLLDVGATVRCEPLDLVRFAVMGSTYAAKISKVAAPRVALLNVGREGSEGGPVLAEAHRRLRRLSGVNFVGNIEGHELLGGRADVVVCEGLVGNVVLKMAEGLAEVVGGLATTAAQQKWRWRIGLAMLETGVGRLRQLTDYASYGGAPLLGFEKILIKAHGRSDARAIANAVKVAAKAVRDGAAREIRAALAQIRA